MKYTKELVAQYVESRDPSPPILLDTLRRYVVLGAQILELGSAGGHDYAALSKDYDVLGSDYSEPFLDYLRRRFPKNDFALLNARSFALEQTFDAVYANKVLHFFSPEELRQSLQCQYAHLKPGGCAVFSLWYGSGSETYGEMVCYSYREADIQAVVAPFSLLESIRYTEFESDDSIIFVLQK